MNKMRTIGRLVSVVFLFAGSAFGDDASDARIKSVIVGSTLYIDNPNLAIEDFRYAKGLCAGDTNRFARLLCEAANTNNAWISDQLISDLGYHGTAAQLPFLYSMATNVQHGASAVRSILRLEGVTSNSIAAVDSCLLTKAIKEPERLGVCRTLVELAYRETTPSNLQEQVLSYVYGHARACDYPAGLDQTLVRLDSGYRQSKRRLSIMREVYAHGVDQWDIAYVTNAINELVAYPEADLPE